MNNMTSAASFSARTSVFLILGMLLALILTFATAPAYTEANLAKYAYGNLALEIWGVEGREKSPPWVFYWVHFIALLGVTSLFFMRNHVEARWAILFSYVFDVRDVLVYVPHIWSLYF